MNTWPNRGASGGPCRGLEENETKQPKQPSDYPGLTQANRPPRNSVRFSCDVGSCARRSRFRSRVGSEVLFGRSPRRLGGFWQPVSRAGV